MATVISEGYDAFRDAGASEKARRAAETMATHGVQLSDVRVELKKDISDVRFELKQGLADVRSELKQDIADVRSDVRLLKWQVAALFAVTAPTLWLVLRVAAKVGALPG